MEFGRQAVPATSYFQPPDLLLYIILGSERSWKIKSSYLNSFNTLLSLLYSVEMWPFTAKRNHALSLLRLLGIIHSKLSAHCRICVLESLPWPDESIMRDQHKSNISQHCVSQQRLLAKVIDSKFLHLYSAWSLLDAGILISEFFWKKGAGFVTSMPGNGWSNQTKLRATGITLHQEGRSL